jgi:hypothetical protein
MPKNIAVKLDIKNLKVSEELKSAISSVDGVHFLLPNDLGACGLKYFSAKAYSILQNFVGSFPHESRRRWVLNFKKYEEVRRRRAKATTNELNLYQKMVLAAGLLTLLFSAGISPLWAPFLAAGVVGGMLVLLIIFKTIRQRREAECKAELGEALPIEGDSMEPQQIASISEGRIINAFPDSYAGIKSLCHVSFAYGTHGRTDGSGGSSDFGLREEQRGNSGPEYLAFLDGAGIRYRAESIGSDIKDIATGNQYGSVPR